MGMSIAILLWGGLIGSCQSHANSVILTQKSESQSKELSKLDLEIVLAYLRKNSPQVHEDALRVWKHFKSGMSEPHLTYRFWARDMILWLRKNRRLSFETQEKVGEVFRLLHNLGTISKDAAILLTTDVWSFLVYREGVPDREQKRASPKVTEMNDNNELDT